MRSYAQHLTGFPLNFVVKLNTQMAEVYCYFISENRVILASAVWSQNSKDWRQSNKLTFKVIQSHRLLLQSKPHIWLSVSDCQLSSISHHFRDVGIALRSHRQVAQLWQRDRAMLDTFSINIHRYSQNHAQNCIFGPPYETSGEM